MIRRVLIAALVTVPLASHARPAFLSAPDAVKQVADGKPWTGLRKGGKTVRMTINPDKTFVFEGPMTIEDAWFLRGEEICLKMGIFLGDKCLRFAPADKGFDAFEDGEPVFSLTRP
jgi:hypothetical protein